MEAHGLNGTWEIVKLPPGKHAIGSRWFMKVKHNADGSLDHYKARLVAKGYSQCSGFDFKKTFAPTVRYSTIRIILAIAALEDLELRSVDISHAYLNGELEEEQLLDLLPPPSPTEYACHSCIPCTPPSLCPRKRPRSGPGST